MELTRRATGCKMAYNNYRKNIAMKVKLTNKTIDAYNLAQAAQAAQAAAYQAYDLSQALRYLNDGYRDIAIGSARGVYDAATRAFDAAHANYTSVITDEAGLDVLSPSR